MAAEPSIYRDDLAYAHDVGFGLYAREAAPGILGILREAGVDEGTVVDLGCGSGILLRELSAAGYATVGIDPSPSMLRLATAAAPGAHLICSPAEQADIPPCDAVTAIGEILCYLPASATNERGLLRLFRRIAAALRPGGVLVFDALVADRGDPMCYRNWRQGEDWAVLSDVDEDKTRERLTRKITTFRRVAGTWRRSQETHVLRVFARGALEQALREAGLSTRVSSRFGLMRLPTRRLCFRARRTDR
jgi:SAM-dependent methyltransferase